MTRELVFFFHDGESTFPNKAVVAYVDYAGIVDSNLDRAELALPPFLEELARLELGCQHKLDHEIERIE